jgi:exoribonuclease R
MGGDGESGESEGFDSDKAARTDTDTDNDNDNDNDNDTDTDTEHEARRKHGRVVAVRQRAHRGTLIGTVRPRFSSRRVFDSTDTSGFLMPLDPRRMSNLSLPSVLPPSLSLCLNFWLLCGVGSNALVVSRVMVLLRLPGMRTAPSDFQDRLFLAEFEEWRIDELTPRGRLLKVLGDKGDREVCAGWPG